MTLRRGRVELSKFLDTANDTSSALGGGFGILGGGAFKPSFGGFSLPVALPRDQVRITQAKTSFGDDDSGHVVKDRAQSATAIKYV